MLALAIGSTLVASPALAGSRDVQIDIVLNVVQACSISAGGGPTARVFLPRARLRFDNASVPADPAIDVDGSTEISSGGTPITFVCNSQTALDAATFSIDAGLHSAAGGRSLANSSVIGEAGEFVTYRLYQTAARSSATEYTPGTKLPLPGTPVPNEPFTLNIYGRIPGTALANAVAGTYRDTALGTLEF